MVDTRVVRARVAEPGGGKPLKDRAVLDEWDWYEEIPPIGSRVRRNGKELVVKSVPVPRLCGPGVELVIFLEEVN